MLSSESSNDPESVTLTSKVTTSPSTDITAAVVTSSGMVCIAG
jgi:hypothetical protein